MLLEPVLVAFGCVGVDVVLTAADATAGGLEDAVVEEEDDGERDVEGGHGGADLERDVLTDDAPLLDVDAFDEFLVLPAQQRRHRHHQRRRPHHEDHRSDAPHVTVVDVVHVRHRPIPVVRIPSTSSISSYIIQELCRAPIRLYRSIEVH